MGGRGPPGIPGNVSTISAVSSVHVNMQSSHSPAICDITVMEEMEAVRRFDSLPSTVFSSQVANVIPEPGEPVSRAFFITQTKLCSKVTGILEMALFLFLVWYFVVAPRGNLERRERRGTKGTQERW